MSFNKAAVTDSQIIKNIYIQGKANIMCGFKSELKYNLNSL